MKKPRKVYEPGTGITWRIPDDDISKAYASPVSVRNIEIIEPTKHKIFSPPFDAENDDEDFKPGPESIKFIQKTIAQRKKATRNRKELDNAMSDLGLVKVRGSVTKRIYYE